ncbi:hypothetical protein AB1Y20_022999 [Prymnesium parvum]|uniref:Uncharacterized protein n=1 Tax=Prymnesium parvum TaxID=97485 RepID=A0AB34JFF0_PRYPA
MRALCLSVASALLAAHATALHAPPQLRVALTAARCALPRPPMMLAKSSRRAARRAKKSESRAPPPPPAASPAPLAPPPPVVSAVPTDPSDDAVPVVRASPVAPPQGGSPPPSPAAPPPPAAEEEVLVSDDLSKAFVRGKETIADVLPSFDDFRKRDELRAREQAARPPLDLPPTRGSYKTREADDAKETMQDKVMAMLTFDGIDDRPINEDPYDFFDRLIGKGLPNKAGVYTLPYLQTGHMLIILVLLLSSLVSYPGFPLTEVPDEYRALIGQGLGITYLINTAAAFYSRGVAKEKEQPVTFWFVKIFLLGGLALGELKEAVPDPAILRKAEWRAAQKKQPKM